MIDKSAVIHPSSIIEEGAVIGANVRIGPFCVIGSHVEIDEGTDSKSHVVVVILPKSLLVIAILSAKVSLFIVVRHKAVILLKLAMITY